MAFERPSCSALPCSSSVFSVRSASMLKESPRSSGSCAQPSSSTCRSPATIFRTRGSLGAPRKANLLQVVVGCVAPAGAMTTLFASDDYRTYQRHLIHTMTVISRGPWDNAPDEDDRGATPRSEPRNAARQRGLGRLTAAETVGVATGGAGAAGSPSFRPWRRPKFKTKARRARVL